VSESIPTFKSLRSSPRTNLAQAVPLPAPFTVYIEPTNVCNFRCVSCPESFPDYQELAGYYQRMPMSLYRKVVDDLKELAPIKVVKFYHEGEPLLHPDLATMIRMAIDEGITTRTEVTTNASLLTEKRAIEIIDSGLRYITVSIYSVDQGDHRTITQNKIGPQQIAENVATLRRVRDLRGSKTPIIFAQYLHESPAGELGFRAAYSSIADELGVQFRHNWNGSDSRDNDLVSISYAPDESARKKAFQYQKQACPEPFYTLAIKANGDVTVCCIDWNGKLKIGSVLTQSLKDIWHGETLRELQRLHVAKRRPEITACRDCTWIHNFPDNLDELSEQTFMNRWYHFACS
jgi:radical SAM protein with 4Fe4S-binding SPASM domain